jgi:hypothetical protein
MQNAFVESFNGRLRDEFLNETLFTSLMLARLARECGFAVELICAARRHFIIIMADGHSWTRATKASG